jgi:hypothetical protein
MPDSDYGFSYTDFADFRLIRTVTPPIVTEERLSIAVWRFFAMYETDLPFAVISDYSHVESFADSAIPVFKAVIDRSYADRRLLATSWVVGDNIPMRDMLRSILVSSGRSPELVVSSDAEAVAILRAAGIAVPDGA